MCLLASRALHLARTARPRSSEGYVAAWVSEDPSPVPECGAAGGRFQCSGNGKSARTLWPFHCSPFRQVTA